MLEANSNLWTTAADARCITTNGFVKSNGCGVMGAGCAKEAADMDPQLTTILGLSIRDHGNNVNILRHRPPKAPLIAFPVKHHWKDAADPDLIVNSAWQLRDLANEMSLSNVLIPRPGCGNGRLKWTDVRLLLADVLDDRFTIVHVPAKLR